MSEDRVKNRFDEEMRDCSVKGLSREFRVPQTSMEQLVMKYLGLGSFVKRKCQLATIALSASRGWRRAISSLTR